MKLKRPAEEDHDTLLSSPLACLSESPRKRSKHNASLSFPPQTPIASCSTSSPNKHIFSTPKTPFTPYPLQASDSPSNPFGRKRAEKLKLTLPPITSFSKHVALRFQFVRNDVPLKKGGAHRIVRVPMNYTFAHLRSLIAWLFNTPASYHHGSATTEDYLFEVKNKVTVYDARYKPGQIRFGSTFVKVSNVRDPARWGSAYGLADEEDELSDSCEEDAELHDGASQSVTDEDEDWKWADEEDFTLGHAFPRGIDPEIAIIYHHSPSTHIHITVNRSVLPRTRGIANTPHVFFAKGRAFLSPAPLPRPNFTKTIQDIMSSSPARYIGGSGSKSKGKGKAAAVSKYTSPIFSFRDAVVKKKIKSSPRQDDTKEDLTDEDADGDTDLDEDAPQSFNASHPFFHAQGSSPIKRVRDADEAVVLVCDTDDEEEEDDPTLEDFDIEMNPDKWNRSRYSFALYLLRFNDPEGEYDEVDESFFEENTPYDPFDNDEDEDEDFEPEIQQVVQKKAKNPAKFARKAAPPPAEEDVGSDATSEVGERSEDEEEEYEEYQGEVYEGQEGQETYDYEEDYEEYEEAVKDKAYRYHGSTPGLTNCTSSASSLPPSSPIRSSSPATLEYYFPNSSSYSLPDPSEFGLIIDAHYPNKKYSKTPAPPKAKKHRLRIKRLEKRLSKIKKDKFLTKYDESEDGRDEEAEDQAQDENSKEATQGVVVQPGELAMTEDEIWNPFECSQEM